MKLYYLNYKFIKDSNYVLRDIFNSDENINLLKSFIEEILNIKILKILQRNSLEEKIKYFYPDNIKGICDIKALTEKNEEINIGIQIIDGEYIQEKILIYGALIHGNQNLDESDVHKSKTITINILDFEYFSTIEYHKKIQIYEEYMVFHVIELPKFKKSNIETEEEAWIAYFKADSIEMIEKSKKKSAKVKELDNALNNYWMNERL